VPKGKTAVLGLVSSKLAAVESAEYLKRRIDDAARFLPLDQLALSPQCGFSGSRMTEDDQWAKFRTMLAVINDVWA